MVRKYSLFIYSYKTWNGIFDLLRVKHNQPTPATSFRQLWSFLLCHDREYYLDRNNNNSNYLCIVLFYNCLFINFFVKNNLDLRRLPQITVEKMYWNLAVKDPFSHQRTRQVEFFFQWYYTGCSNLHKEMKLVQRFILKLS